MSESIVSVEHLSHRYSLQWAIKDINFELSARGIYGLLGANGAGKSTIMNIMCGIIQQTQGEVFIKGISLKKNAIAAKRYIGFLPQKPPLLTDLTVQEFLTHSANMRLMPEAKIKAAVEKAMIKCNLTHFAKRLIGNLSGGYQQRVGIAQAIIHEPEFVVMDEPTNGLDPNQILEVRNLIREIAQERTVVLSTHILQEVQALCDSIWMINEGKVVFAGTMGDFDNYILPDSLHVSLAAAPPVDELAAIPGVINAQHIGGVQYKIQYRDAMETMERIVETSVLKKWRPTEITKQKTSLENVFAELSKRKSA